MKKIIFLMSICVALFSCTNATNLFVGAGKTPDVNIPGIQILSPSNNDVVKGTIKISGKAFDDLGAEKVEIYHVKSGATGSIDVLIGSVKVNKEQFIYSLDTTVFEDGANLFKAKVIEFDKAKKFSFTNLTLTIDNYGPFVVINQPEENKVSSPIYSRFTAAILPIDYEENKITKIEWNIVSDNNVEHKLEGIIDYGEDLQPVNVNTEFQIDPSGFLKIQGFEPGYCTLNIRCENQNGKFSKSFAEKKIYIDFGDSIPRIYISTPTSMSVDNPTNTGSSITITGLAKDDSSIELIEIEWGLVSGQKEILEIKPSESEKVTTYSIAESLSSLANGVYVVKARVTDDLDNITDWSDEYYFRADSNYPQVEITSPSQGVWAKGSVTVAGNITIGAGSIISSVKYKFEKDSTWTNYSNPNSNSAAFSRVVTPGEYPNGGEVKLYLRGYKNAETYSESSVVFNMDNRIPDVTITNPVVGALQLNEKILIRGNASDFVGSGSTVGIVKDILISISGTSINNQSVVGISSFQYEFDSFAEGIGLTGNQDVTVSLKATDQAGNEKTITRLLKVNQLTDIPVVTVSNLSPGDKKYGIFTVLGTAEDDDGVRDIDVQIDSLGWQKASGSTNWSYKIDSSQLADGAHTFYYRANDIYGKSSEHNPGGAAGYPKIKSIGFLVDPDVPIISFDSSDNDAFSGDLSFKGTINKSTGGTIKKAEIKIIGTSNSLDWTGLTGGQISGLNTSSASFQYPISVATFGNGQVLVYMRAMDDMDKIGERETTIFLDNKKLTGSLSFPTSNYLQTGTTMEIKGSILDDEPSSGVEAANAKIYAINTTDANSRTDIVDGTVNKISTALSNFTYNWSIPASQKDGLYDIYLDATDRAGNGFVGGVKKVTQVRLARYTPVLSNLTVNGYVLTNNTYISGKCLFEGTILDEELNDNVKGINKVEIIQSTDNSFNPINNTALGSKVFSGNPTSGTFSIDCTIAKTHSYIMVRATDKIGGVTEKIYQVIVDFTPPTADFKYSSVGFDGASVPLTTAKGYSDSFWIKLGAIDTIDGTILGNMDGSTVQVGVGTAIDNNSIFGNKIFTIDSFLKLDLKGRTGSIFVNYSLFDKAGNKTMGSLEISPAIGKPALVIPGLTNSWINTTLISVAGSSGTVKYSSLDYTGGINDLTGNLTAVVGGNIKIGAAVDGDHDITVITTDAQSRNVYNKYSFTLDKELPEISSFSLNEDEGAIKGRVDGTNISGKVTFSGVIIDNEQERLNSSDFVIKVSINSDVTNISSSSTLIKQSNNTFSWSWEYNTETYPQKVGNNIPFVFTVTDKAGNISIDESHNYNIVPYIRSITESSGKIVAVKRWDSTKSEWNNTNYDEAYSYRINGSDTITLNGFNLNASGNETITFSGGSKTWTVAAPSDSEVTFNLSGQGINITRGNLTLSTGGITSNAKIINVFNNYAAPVGYSNTAECDMVLQDDGNALILVQKHYQQDIGTGTTTRPTVAQNVSYNGSGIFRFIETAEETFNAVNVVATNFISHSHNRYWFVNLVKDQNHSGTQTDSKYYLFQCDSENVNNYQTGLLLSGSLDGWNTLNPASSVNGSGQVFIPKNDWNFSYANNVNLNSTQADREYANRWRPAYVAGDGATAYNDMTVTTKKDWSIPWGDLYAYNNNIHMVWYSQMDNKTYYRRIANGTANSVKYPTGGPIDLGITGNSYPAITINNDGYPLIAAYDEGAGAMKVFLGDAVTPTSFDATTVETGIFAYPKISCIESGGNVHLFYQDKDNGSLKYAYATTPAGLDVATKVALDSQGVPGNYNDIRVVDNKPAVTYIASGYLNTGNAVRLCRYVGTGVDAAAYNNKSNWEIVTLPSERSISDNKVRGYIVGSGATARHFGFARSDRPEFFREK